VIAAAPVGLASAGQPAAHGPSKVKIHKLVTYWSDAMPPGADVSVTLQLGSYVGTNNGAVGVKKTFYADDDGLVEARFRWPSRWYTCAGAEYCHAHKWPQNARVQVQICDSGSVCARKWVRVRH